MTTSDVIALVNALFALGAVILAGVATKYARDSAVAARETVKPMEDMAAGISTSATRLEAVASGIAASATTLRALQDEANAALADARSARQEERLLHRLHQYERVTHAVEHCSEGWNRMRRQMPDMYFNEGLAALRAALSVLPAEDLPACRALAKDQPGHGGAAARVMDARIEIDRASEQVRDELHSAAPPVRP
jgi:hypothetical protein